LQKGDILLTVGAGDVWQICDQICEKLEKKQDN